MEFGNLSKVLVVDDDEGLRDLISNFFEFEGVSVDQSQNGLAAQTQIQKNTYDLIVSDIKMPIMSGIELLKWCKTHEVASKFILVSGFSELLEMKSAYELGANGFLPKPFNARDLRSLIEEAIEEKPVVTEGSEGIDYIPLHMDEFYSSATLISDIYIELSDKKYIRVAKAGEAVPKERMEQYKQRGLNYLSITKEDFPRYVEFNLKLAGVIKDTTKLSKKTKYKQLKHAVEVFLVESFLEGVDKTKINIAKNIVMATVDNIAGNQDAMDLLESLKKQSELLFSHSVGVALYSTLIAREMGWTSLKNLGLLAMGGLYHDIGKKEFTQDLLNTPRNKFSLEQLKIWETHPIRGRDILMDTIGIPSEVIQVALHHHENLAGRGFPYKISGKNIHPFAQIVSVSNLFCNYCLKSREDIVLAPNIAFLKLLDYHLEEINPKPLVELMKLFGALPPKELLDRVKG